MEKYIGDRFGRLVAVVRIDGRLFRFQCDCGNAHQCSIYDARLGKVTSCGCARDERARVLSKTRRSDPASDLTGQRFGMLTVDRRGKNNRHSCATWVCLCDCGTEKIVSGNHLVTGNTASCGCARRRGLVVRPDDARARSNAYVKARMRKDVRYSVNRRALQLVRTTLRVRGNTKSQALVDLLGYTVDDLVKRLESTMPAGKAWGDFLSGSLQIDHIIPQAAFNFERETDLDFRRCWALENLRLLAADENLKKGASLAEPFQPSLSF